VELDTLLTIVRDHLVPRFAGGHDGQNNRVLACAACDRPKADTVVPDTDAARALIARERQNREKWFFWVRSQFGR